MISVIVNCFNSEKTIGKCLDSLVNQTNKDFEVVAVDDGSTDSTLEIIDTYKDKLNLIVIKKKNGGPCSASAFGIRRASGNHIAFMDSDDTCSIDFIETISKEIEDCDYLCLGYNAVYKNKIATVVRPPRIWKGGEEIKQLKETLYFDNHSFSAFNHLFIYRWTSVVKKEVAMKMVDEYERWNFGMYEDLTYQFLCLEHCSKVKRIEYAGINYYQRKSTHSRNSGDYEELLKLRARLRDFLDEYSQRNDIPSDVFSTMEFDVSKFYLSRCIKKESKKISKQLFLRLKKDDIYQSQKRLVNLNGESFKRKLYFKFLKYDWYMFVYMAFKYISKTQEQ